MLYIISAFVSSENNFIMYTIILVALILWKLYKSIKKTNRLKKFDNLDTNGEDINKKDFNNQRISAIFSIGFSLISLIVISLYSYFIITYEGDIVMDFIEIGLLLEIEKDDYYEKMDVKENENFDIVYNKDIEATLPLIEKYIEEIKEKNKKLLGTGISDKVTIQIDYDEEVFRVRDSLFSGIVDDSIGGYYNRKSDTIYIYTNDPVNDILMDRSKINIIGDFISISDISFKDILFHEYTHYAIDNFLEENNIENSLVPRWFEEGIAHYMMGNDSLIDTTTLEYTSFKDLESFEDWRKSMIESENNIYQQSKYAILNIVEEKGEQVLKDMLLSFNDKNSEIIIKEYMGYSFEEFENSLRMDIKQGKFEDIINNNERDIYVDTMIKCLEAYIKYDENSIGAYEYLGTIYEGKNKNDKVVDLFKTATEKNPKEFILWHRLGIAYENVGENSLAKECFEKSNLLKDDKLQ